MPATPPSVVLLTGLPSTGKTTLGRALAGHLAATTRCQLLDGDELRERLVPPLGFTVQDRRHQGRRALYLAELLLGHDVTVVVAIIAPLEETRRAFREAFERRYVEVHLHAPADVRARRDAHGVYARAVAAGDVTLETVDGVYEVPVDPDVAIDTSATSLDSALAEVLAALGA